MSSRQDLERRLDALRSFRVRTRRAIEQLTKTITFGDVIDNRRRLEQLEFNLGHSDREWRELHVLLGKRLPGGPVVRLSARTAARSPATTRRAPISYMTKVMVPG